MTNPDVAARLIGKPYHHLTYTCWHHVIEVQRALYGRELPEILVDTRDRRAVVAAFEGHEEHARWREVKEPVDGAVVLMAKRSRDAHAGTYVALDEGLIMHCDQPHGVVAERPLELTARCWGRLRYFVPV